MDVRRNWCVLLAVHGHQILEVSVWADEDLLVPTTRCQPPSLIITQLMAALVDFRDGDAITAVVHGAGPITAWSGNNVHLALHWIATALMTAWWPAPSTTTGLEEFEDSLETGVRKSLSPRDTAAPNVPDVLADAGMHFRKLQQA